MDEHAGEAEGNLLRELLARHGHLEAVPEVDVEDLPAHPVQQEVGWVAVAETQDVPDHGHHGKGTGEVGAAVEPNLDNVFLEHFRVIL